MLGSGKVDVYGSNTNNPLLVAARLPGATFILALSSPFISAVAMPKARPPAAEKRLSSIVEAAAVFDRLPNAIQKAGLKR